MAQRDPFESPELSVFYGGYVPGPMDPRNYPYPRLASPQRLAAARQDHDLRDVQGQSLCMPIADQGQVGSCAAWSWGYELRGMLSARDHVLGGSLANLNDTASARFIYDVGRGPEFMNTYPQDSGMELMTGAQVLYKYGCAPEGDLPYQGHADDGPLSNEITPHVLEAAAYYGIAGYYQLQGTGAALIDSILLCLDQGYPCTIAFLVEEPFEQCPGSGIIPAPNASNQILGGHMVTVVGNFFNAMFPGGLGLLIQNHWRRTWGATNNPDTAGFAYLPAYPYATTQTRYGPFLQGAATAR